MRLAGRVALVTGASRGIGAAVARGFAREGAAVMINHPPGSDQMQRSAEDVATEIRAAGGTALAVCADVADRDQVERMVAEIGSAAGGVDILVNNAAQIPLAEWSEITTSEWNRVQEVNMTGPLHCAQATFPHMREQGYGKIINVTSVTVELGHTSKLHYVTSKAGVIGFTRSLAREVGPHGIRVNAVMPGAIRTEHELETFPGQAEEIDAMLFERQCLPYRGVAEDMVGAFLYLAAPESDFVTGQILTVDGGWTHR
jgi:3-oxoacyl-[acyl-carrier protein] reductase